MWATRPQADDDIVGTVWRVPTWVACIVVVGYTIAGLALLQQPRPRAARTYYVDLRFSAPGWQASPIHLEPPPLGSASARVRIDLHEYNANGRGPTMILAHTATLVLDSYSPDMDRERALDALQSNWIGVADAAEAAWPGHALKRAICAGKAPVYTIQWRGALQSVLIIAGVFGLWIVVARGQESVTDTR